MRNILKICFHRFCWLLILTTSHHAVSTSHNIVKSLPGFPGKLPFYLETGYIGVGENEKEEEVELFYYFMKSERNAKEDPLMLWLTGGPGCSALSGLVIEIGPLMFNTTACNWHSKALTFQLNPSSWTKVANIIFLDSPVGTGFSYATNPIDYYSDDITQSWQIYQFLRKWILEHAEFQNNPLYISGDSYCGKIIPVIVQEILNGNNIGLEPSMNLQGYVLGNPLTGNDQHFQISKFHFAHRVSLFSDELYESTKIYCNFTNEDANADDVKCQRNKQDMSDDVDSLFYPHILKPKCMPDKKTWCKESIYQLLDSWANDIEVRAALRIKEGTKSYWVRCNKTLAYSYNVESSVPYHQKFTQEFIRALIYSGDQDLVVSYVDTKDWIKMLSVPIVENWRPWIVNGQVAGYTTKYANDNYRLTYATVKGAGHTAAEYKRQECFTMINKWLSMHPL